MKGTGGQESAAAVAGSGGGRSVVETGREDKEEEVTFHTTWSTRRRRRDNAQAKATQHTSTTGRLLRRVPGVAGRRERWRGSGVRSQQW